MQKSIVGTTEPKAGPPAVQNVFGGGVQLGVNADVVSDNFLASTAEDILERYESTVTTNLRQSLESCLFLTDSKCNVPDALQTELGAKQITLGQYLMKGKQ